ncbi:MAG: 50S ribosomal protein L4 [Nitrososphaerales archaeon]
MNSDSQVRVLDLEGKEIEDVKVPRVFRLLVRQDLILRAFISLDSHRRAVQGRDPLAGERTTAETSNPPTGRGISRIPRVKGEQYSKSGMAGGVASIVHGRLPFPPRSEKVIRKEINKKERRLALAHAIAATADQNIVSKRGHHFKSDLPIVISDEVEKLAKVRDLKKLFVALGAEKEFERVNERTKKERTRYARVKRSATGPLFVVSDSRHLKGILKSVSGFSVVKGSELSVLDLAPGSAAGRLTIWSKSALTSLPKPVIEIGERYAS